MSEKIKIVVLVSGGGTNLQALIDAEANGKLKNGHICAVVSSNADAYALRRAENAGIPSYVVLKKNYRGAAEYDAALSGLIENIGAGLIVMAGFMSVLGPDFCRRFSNRIINVHPSLIPSFCGKGFYGLRVHEAALQYGVKVTGATVHFVNEVTDGGAVILQKAVCVLKGDTPESLQQRVMKEAEWILLPQAVSLFCEGKLKIIGNTVNILD